MLICRVIAGRVKASSSCDDRDANPSSSSSSSSSSLDDSSSGGSYDSFSPGEASDFNNNVDELIVFNNKAVLPCFVVVYDTC
jgi:hypothetical protein